jgi:hypothetical protein
MVVFRKKGNVTEPIHLKFYHGNKKSNKINSLRKELLTERGLKLHTVLKNPMHNVCLLHILASKAKPTASLPNFCCALYSCASLSKVGDRQHLHELIYSET